MKKIRLAWYKYWLRHHIEQAIVCDIQGYTNLSLTHSLKAYEYREKFLKAGGDIKSHLVWLSKNNIFY
jgi:tRNA 2-selenouridine synthase SelU